MLAPMPRPDRRTATFLTCSALALGSLAGCGGSSTGTSAGKVSATSYVGQVCTSVASWYRGLQEHVRTLNGQLGPHTSPAQGKRALESFLDTTVGDTEAATSALKGAGVPAVANGGKISSALVSAFERAGGTLKGLRPRVSALPASNGAAVSAESKHVTEAVQAIPLELGTGVSGSLTSPELDKAASESPACKSVGARPKR
jgi:hypothetical protein